MAFNHDLRLEPLIILIATRLKSWNPCLQHLPQDSSSLPSEQCGNGNWSRSQSSVEFMQVISPVVHLKPPSRHLQSPAIHGHNRCHKIAIQILVINKPHNPSASSIPSVQSSSPSHTQSHGMHCRFPIVQLNLSLLQFTSSGKINRIGFLACKCIINIAVLLPELVH